MDTHRSPKYPSITLREAIEKAKHIYDKEHTYPAPRPVVATHLGYKSLNGSSAKVLATLKGYGLLQGGEGGLGISEEAVTIFELPDNDDRKRQALDRCARKPSLFSQLLDQFGTQVPSDAKVRHFLVPKGYLPKAADAIVHIYRHNMEFVQQSKVAGSQQGEFAEDTDIAVNDSSDAGRDVAGAHADLPTTSQKKQLRRDVCSVSEGELILIWPVTIGPESLAYVEDWFDALKRKMAGKSEAQQPAKEQTRSRTSRQ